jgi:hypothetical protein
MAFALTRRSGGPYGKEFWEQVCGFLDYSGSQFFKTQETLLAQQIGKLGQLPVAGIMRTASSPRSISELRRDCRLTTYEDYAACLRQEYRRQAGSADTVWAFTSYGAGNEKWVPYTAQGLDVLTRGVMAAIVLAAAEKPGDVKVGPGDRVIYNVPPRPYLAGIVAVEIARRYGLKGVIPPEEAEQLEFRHRTRAEFKKALNTGVDVLISMTSVLNRISDTFSNDSAQDNTQAGGAGRSGLGLRGMTRYAASKARARISGRRMIPADLWKPKAIVGWGLDTRFYRDRIGEQWGRSPYELYASTEAGPMGVQYRDDGGIALNPEACFFEFVPESEIDAALSDDAYSPKTALLDEVKHGGLYEVVVTSFYGMPFVRYRTGQLVRFTDSYLGYGPELEYIGRADERIDIGGFTRIDEATLWKSVAECGTAITDWVLRREVDGSGPVLHLYAETSVTAPDSDLVERLHASLIRNDPLYADLESMLGMSPLRFTRLSAGTFDRFYEERRNAGVDLMSRKPKRMNADDETVGRLLRMSGRAEEIAA